jgi:selenocysteine lyase/cysteine desulfurase
LESSRRVPFFGKKSIMLSCQRARFTLDETVHYLNAATMSPNLKSVEAAGIAGLLLKSQPWRITQETFFTGVEAVRERAARLLHAPDAQRIALIPSVSYGMATVAKNLRARAGQHILLVHEEFPSDVYAWEGVCRTQGLTVRTVRPPDAPEGRGRRWNERLLDALSPDTALLVISPVHWSDGTRFDLDALGRRCRDVGALFCIDATQCAGAYPLDLAQLRPDALVAGGYKWLMSAYGMGLAYFGPTFDGGYPLEENWINRKGSENFRYLMDYTTEYRPGAARYGMGEQSNFIHVAMLEAALDQLLAWTPAAVQDYCRALVRPFAGTWQGLGYWLEDESARASHLFGLRLPAGTSMERLREELTRRNVYVSTRGTALRVSPHVYNDARDLEVLTEALRVATFAARA